MSENYTPRLKKKYMDEIAPAMMKKFGEDIVERKFYVNFG